MIFCFESFPIVLQYVVSCKPCMPLPWRSRRCARTRGTAAAAEAQLAQLRSSFSVVSPWNRAVSP